jgi:hypothetical protein
VRAAEFLSHFDTTPVDDLLRAAYRREPTYPAPAMLKSVFFFHIKGWVHWPDLERHLETHPEDAVLLGFPRQDGEVAIPSWQNLWHFANIRLKGKWDEVFSRLRDEVVRKGRELGLPVLDRALDMLTAIAETCKELDKKIHEAFLASKEAQLLESIPGIGELTAVTLVAEVCPIERFPNIDKFCAHAGLAPTTYQAGEKAYHGHLIRDCNTLAQSALVEAAWGHRFHEKSSDVSKKGRRAARRRGKNIGNVAAAHSLAKIVYAVLRRGTSHVPERPGRVDSATTPAEAA